MPRRYDLDPAKGILEVDWPLFGELSRALALRVARGFDPEVVIGIANAGVIPGATIAAILEREFHSMLITRREGNELARETPSVFGNLPRSVRGLRVLLVDETCDSGDTIRLAEAAIINGGAAEVRSAVSFKTGRYEPDFHALATESTIILPWDREILLGGELVTNPKYAPLLRGKSDSPYAEDA